jgi:hypothetical protein
MEISTLYKVYFQKSKIFVYPLLDIKKGTGVTPIQTYFRWEGNFEPEDNKLVAVYEKREDETFINFEKNILLKHTRLIDYQESEGIITCIFDFDDIKTDWEHLINGRYSKMNPKIKRKIKDYFKDSASNAKYIESYLYPEKFYPIYAELLAVNISLLQTAVELCDKPNMEKESLVFDQVFELLNK